MGHLRPYRGIPLKTLLAKEYLHVAIKDGGEGCAGIWVSYGPRWDSSNKSFSGEGIPACGNKGGRRCMYWPMGQLRPQRIDMWNLSTTTSRTFKLSYKQSLYII